MEDVEWHPYPADIPEEDEFFMTNFFVTVKYTDTRRKTVIKTQLAQFNPTAKRGSALQWYKPSSWNVLAWARINFPKPYEPLDMHPDAIAARKYAENFDARHAMR